MTRRIWTIARRELRSYFDHATAYILLVVFLGINFFFFFRDAYLVGEASLRPMMGLLPWLLLFFVPAVSMRTLAEEHRAGTMELVLAQPIGVAEYLLGKFLGVFLFLAIAMAATLGVPLGLSLGADLQAGVIFAQYVGSAFLIAALVAIGLWASSMTRNQVTAFILGVSVTFVLYLIGLEVVVLGLPSLLSTIAVRIGILGHFQNVARGVIDFRDVLYFAAVAAAFLSLTYHSIMRERLSREREAYRRLRVGSFALVALAIFTALAGGQLRGRLDLTPGKLYTLSEPTRDLLEGLDDLLTIKFFRSDEVPPELAPLRRDIEDLLRDFAAVGGSNVNLVQVDPADDPEVAREANGLGIDAARFNVFGQDEVSIREGYLGIALQYAGESDAIPLVQRTSDLEYRLASMIRGLTSDRRPVVALLTGHSEMDRNREIRIAAGRLGEEYQVENLFVDSTMTAIPDSIDVVVIAGPRTPLDAAEGELLGRYLDEGGSLMLLLAGTQVDAQSLFAGPAYNPVLDSLLQTRGLGVVPAVAFDMQLNERVQVPAAGGYVILPYPLWPFGQIVSDHITVRDVSPVPLRWPSPILMDDADTTLVTPLLATSEFGGRLQVPASVDANQDWRSIAVPEELEPQVLAVAYSDTTSASRMILVGTPSIIADEVVTSASGPAGLIFFQNAIDWLAADEALISIRSKDRSPPQLAFPSAVARDAAKYGNLIGVPVLFVLFGILRLARRRRLQQRVYEPGGAIL